MPSFKSTDSVSSDSDVYFHGSTLNDNEFANLAAQPSCFVEEYASINQIDKAIMQQNSRKHSYRRITSNQNIATPLKFNLAEVIYEEDNELTMTHIKENDQPSNSGKKTEILKGHRNSVQRPKQKSHNRMRRNGGYGRSTTLGRKYNSNCIEISSLESLIEENDGDL